MKRILILACLLVSPLWATRVAQFHTPVDVPIFAEVSIRQGPADEPIFSVEVRDRFERHAYFDHCTGSYHSTKEWNLNCEAGSESIVLFGNRPDHRLSDLAVFKREGQKDVALYLSHFPNPEHPRGFLFEQKDCKGRLATQNPGELGGSIVWECRSERETLVFSETGCKLLRDMIDVAEGFEDLLGNFTHYYCLESDLVQTKIH